MDKAMEAPKRIYLQVCGDCHGFNCDTCKFENLEDNVTWCKDHIFPKDIEYTRTDAFMKKAENFLEMLGYWFTITDNITHKNYDEEQLIADFRKYMEGE